MATDPNDILLKLGLDASKFDNAINQVQKEFDTLGVIIDGSSAKIRFFTDATGKTVAKFSALSTEGDKLFATLEKGRRTFEFVNAGLEISAAAAEKTAKALERKAASAKKAEEADIRAAAAIQKQIEADEKRLTTLARSAEKEIQLERERQSQKLTASESSQSKKEVAELAALERINARLQKKRQDADDAELNRAKKNFDRLGRQYEAQRQADADKAARDEVTKQERLERINARLQKKRQDEEHNKPGFIGNLLSSASGGASDVGISAFLGSAAGGLVGGLASSALSSTISAFRAGITEAVNFERELAHLAAISASTKVTTDQLSESIINLSNRFNLDRNDVAKAKIFALQDGLSKTNEESDKLLETSAALAQSTGSALVDSTETLTSTLNAFGLKATDANRAAAILLTTVQDGKLPLRETNTVLGQLGTQLSPFGIRLEEVAGILSVLHTKSVTANESLTLLSNIFNRLANPGTNKGIRDFFNREGVANLDQLVASKGAVGILRDLSQEASKGSSELAELFGQSKSGKAAVVLVSNFKEIEAAIKKASTETNNLSDALKQVQNNAGENLSSKLNIFKNALLQIGDAIITAFGKPDGLNGLAKDMEKLAEASQRLARINAHSEEKVNAELTKQVETEKQILEVKKQLQSGAGLKPGTDVSLIDVEKIRSLRPTFKDQNGKIRHFSPNEIDPGEFSDLGDVGADAIKKANELRLTERQLDAIKAEQTRQAKVKELRDSQEKAEKDFTTRINEFGQQQVANAKESFNARQSAHFKMIEGQAEQEKTLTQTIKNNFDIQLRRADEEVHKIEEVAKKSESIRKDSLERVQSAEDDFETRRFQRQQKLFGKSPFLLAQLNQQRDTQLKSDAFGLVNALPNLGDDDFLASKNIEIARKKLSERTGNQEATLDKTIEARLQGKASDQDVLNAQQKLVQYKQDEYDLEKKLRDISKEKEESKKAEADSQKLVVDTIKNNVSAVLEFNPFVDKNAEPGHRGVAGSPTDQFSKFEQLVTKTKDAKKNLSVSELVNFDSAINQKRDQLKREIGLETGESSNAKKIAELNELGKGNLTPDKVVQIVEGFDKLGKSLQTGGKESGVIGKLEGFGAALDDVTRKINERNANNPSFAAQVHGVKVSQTDEGVSNVGTTIRNNITINVSSDDPNQAGKVLRDELRKQARRGIIITGEVGED